MTGGGDTGELEEGEIETGESELEERNESDDDGEGIAPVAGDVSLNLNDRDPSAGGSDIGGRAGGDD